MCHKLLQAMSRLLALLIVSQSGLDVLAAHEQLTRVAAGDLQITLRQPGSTNPFSLTSDAG